MNLKDNNCVIKKRDIDEIFIIDKLIDSYLENNAGINEINMNLTCEKRKNFLMSFINIMNIDLSDDLIYELDKLNCKLLNECNLEVSDFKYFEKILPRKYDISDFIYIIKFLKSKFYADLKSIIKSGLKYLKYNDRCSFFKDCDYSILDSCVASVIDEIEFSFKFPMSYELAVQSEYIKKKFEYYELLIMEKSDEDLVSYLVDICLRYDSKNKK